MMAYLLMKVPGKDVNQVMDALRAMPEVVEASTVYGESDIIARLETATQVELDNFVMERVHGIPAVESTRTYIVVGSMHWKRGKSLLPESSRVTPRVHALLPAAPRSKARPTELSSDR